MNKGIAIALKNHLFSLIIKVSGQYGGDDLSWLKRHFLEVLEMYPGYEIEKAIECYKQLAEESKYYSK